MPDKEGADIVWGGRAIGEAINQEERQALYLLRTGQLPARKVGARWAASRRKLLEHLTKGGANASAA